MALPRTRSVALPPHTSRLAAGSDRALSDPTPLGNVFEGECDDDHVASAGGIISRTPSHPAPHFDMHLVQQGAQDDMNSPTAPPNLPKPINFWGAFGQRVARPTERDLLSDEVPSSDGSTTLRRDFFPKGDPKGSAAKAKPKTKVEKEPTSPKTPEGGSAVVAPKFVKRTKTSEQMRQRAALERNLKRQSKGESSEFSSM